MADSPLSAAGFSVGQINRPRKIAVETVGYCRVSQGDRKPIAPNNRRFGDPGVLVSSFHYRLFVFRFLGLRQVLKQFFEIVPFAECVEVGVRLHVFDVVVTRLDRLVQPRHRQIRLFLGKTISVRRRSFRLNLGQRWNAAALGISLAMECCPPRNEPRNGFFVPLGHPTIAHRFNGGLLRPTIGKSPIGTTHFRRHNR